MNKDLQAAVYTLSFASIVGSIVLFLRGRRDSAIFVGLFAPTLLGLATFWNTERPPYKE
ncbi:MAG: hypothetical protein ACLQVD_12300 [Capsulimonadaceae bacterium]